MKKGYVQIYTGNGKGKTTASLGLTLRAAGAGMKVFIGQFTKGKRCSEHAALERFDDLVTIKQYGNPGFIFGEPSDEDRELARKGLDEIRRIISEGNHDVVIMEEANIAVYYGLVSTDEMLEIIRTKPEHIELVITGRYAKPELIEAADLVTEMKEIKHYCEKGVPSRIGIEE
ncbi:MAG: cob(I)yrinic acid a,c-diamide adenosyltransferase [Verrucomicrobiota bacterium]